MKEKAGVLRDATGLRKRIAELEAEVHECRQANLRLAELTDLVVDLIVPLARGEQEKVDVVLARYQESINETGR